MKIDPTQYLTIAEAAEAIGAPGRRAVYRAINRAKEDGEETTASLFGKTLVKREAIETLKAYYFPFGSEQRHELAVYYGSLGGTKKQQNWRKANRSRGSS